MCASCSRPQEDRPEKAWRLALRGLGRGEVCALAVDDVDREAGELSIRDTAILVDPRTQESTPQTARGNRALPLPDSLVRVLKRARRRPAAHRLLFGCRLLRGRRRGR